MRKLLVYSILTMIFLCSTALAQMTMGIKAGGIGATQFGDIEDNTMKIGFFGGPFIMFPMGESFAIQPEIRFSMEGTKYKYLDQSSSITCSYIEVPVLAKTMFLQENEIRPSFYFGPQVSFLLSAKNKVVETTTDVKDQYNNIDAGVLFGLDFINDRNLITDIRVGVGLLNLVDDDAGDETNRNANVSVGIGFLF